MSTTSNVLNRDLYILEDEENPQGSKSNQIYPSTTISQVIDDESPVYKTLRDVINEIRDEITHGGSEPLIFPVTSVNGMTGDVYISARTIGLENVDNTSDMDKPMSIPQRQEMEKRLLTFNPKVDLSELHNHINDTNNPHNVTIEQLNQGGYIDGIINSEISIHNTSNKAHTDIRNTMTLFNSELDQLKRSTDISFDVLSQNIMRHLQDNAAHASIFNTKEDVKNKSIKIQNPNNNTYPTTKAVVDYVLVQLEEMRNSLNDPDMWLDDILVISDRSKLPEPDGCYIHKAYFIREGIGAQAELAICRQLEDDTYSWDISQYGPVSRFSDQFIDTSDGMKLNLEVVSNEIISSEDMSKTISDTATKVIEDELNDYYSKEDINNMNLVSNIKLVTGTMNGCIRFYINDDPTTMSDDVRVSGLQKLAFMETINSDEIEDSSILSRHIGNNTIINRHIANKSINAKKLTADYMTVFANVSSETDNVVEQVPIQKFVDTLKPLLSDLDINLEIVDDPTIVTMVNEAFVEVNDNDV